MARPQKIGVDYFPLNVDIDQDDKVAIVEAEHGMVGFAIIIKLLMKIYSEGYYYKWEEKEQLLFSRRVNVNINDINAIIKSSTKWGLFNEKLFETHSILTSEGIQRRFLEIAKRRKSVDIVTQYLLLHKDEVNAYNNLVYVDINPHTEEVNEDIGTQSKVKESKVKESTNKRVLEKLDLNPEWKVLVSEWLQYKKERRESYKSERGIKAFVTKLKNLSGDNVAVAKKITEQSFANNWAGIFELKGGNNGKDRRDSETADRERQIMQLARDAGMA